MLVDSSYNLAKEMHVGHLRSTPVGDALRGGSHFLGAAWFAATTSVGGTPFGMLIEHLFDEWLAGRVSTIGRPASSSTDRRRVVSLQSGDAETLALWHQLIAGTVEHIDALYRRLGVTPGRCCR
jgi:arginyl-tRNA synthetase